MAAASTRLRCTVSSPDGVAEQRIGRARRRPSSTSSKCPDPGQRVIAGGVVALHCQARTAAAAASRGWVSSVITAVIRPPSLKRRDRLLAARGFRRPGQARVLHEVVVEAVRADHADRFGGRFGLVEHHCAGVEVQDDRAHFDQAPGWPAGAVLFTERDVEALDGLRQRHVDRSPATARRSPCGGSGARHGSSAPAAGRAPRAGSWQPRPPAASSAVRGVGRRLHRGSAGGGRREPPARTPAARHRGCGRCATASITSSQASSTASAAVEQVAIEILVELADQLFGEKSWGCGGSPAAKAGS